MSHNLFGSRFYSNREAPWHGLGYVSEVEMTAAEAFNTTMPFIVSLEDLYTEIGESKFELAYRAIMRHPVPDDPEYKTLGIVGPNYTLIDPLTLCETFDDAVRKPVETLGALGSGETLFLTTRLPSFSVLGDDVDNYLLIVSPYTGNAALQIRLTPIRVVCQNTLIAAKAESTENYRIVHDAQAVERLGLWMRTISDRFEAKSDALQQTFTAMAKTHVSGEDVEALLELIYPFPSLPTLSPVQSDNVRRQGWHEENVDGMRRRRQAVKEVFMGAGVGQDTEAAQGTAWGLFNAVVEYEQYRPSPKPVSAAASMLVGDRAATSERAFSTIVDWAFDR